MSEQEQDAVIGRLVRDHSDAKKKEAVMKTKLEQLHKAFSSLANGLAYNADPSVNLVSVKRELQNESLASYEFGRLTAFLEEYAEVHQDVCRMNVRLKELGI